MSIVCSIVFWVYLKNIGMGMAPPRMPATQIAQQRHLEAVLAT